MMTTSLQTRRPLNCQGFSLVELMIVVAILGILTAISVPIYSSYKLRSNRSLAKVGLLDGAQRMERHFTRNNTYVGGTVPADLAGSLYVISFSDGPAVTDFILQAVAAGAQTSDTDCTPLTINQLGVKTPAPCW